MSATSHLPISFRFLGVVGLVCLLAGSSFLLLIFGPASYEQLEALGQQTYHEGGYRHLPLALTPDLYLLLRSVLAVATAGSFGLLVGLGYSRKSTWQDGSTQFRLELRLGLRALMDTVRGLPVLEKRVAFGLLMLILAVRVWYLGAYVLGTDEVASYDYFVQPGPFTISCFYPIPNNHLLFNFTCWPLTFLTNNTRLVMRLPTFIASAAGTVLGYLFLLRWGGFRVATLATGLFSFLPLSLYYAVAGRGYALQMTLLLLAFFGATAVVQTVAYRRLGWVLFITASILGFYTIPTFLYPFASLGLGLGLLLAWQRRWLELGHMGVASGIVGLIAGLLYLPVLCVSGWRLLAGNHYVAPMAGSVFWPQYLRYLRILADMLAGNGRVGLVGGGSLLVLGPVLMWWLPRSTRALAGLAWLLLATPLLLMAVQHVQVPARVLLYVGYFSCLLGSLAATALLNHWRIPARMQLLLGLLVVVSYGGYQFQRQLAPHHNEVREQTQMQEAYAWLSQQGNPQVLLAAPDYELFFWHYARQENRPLRLYSVPVNGHPYDYTVQAQRTDPLPAWALPPFYLPAYRNESVVIYKKAK